MQDAHQAVGQLARRGLVTEASVALLVVVGAGPGEALSADWAWRPSASMSRSLCTWRACTVFFLRLRLLNGSNARTYRLHLVTVRQDANGALVVTPQHDRVLVIGTGGGLLWLHRQDTRNPPAGRCLPHEPACSCWRVRGGL
jgi:hypothetical protein